MWNGAARAQTVFGALEWIGLCDVAEDHANMLPEAQGSIDVPEIRNRVADSLDGGNEAFMQHWKETGFAY